MASTSARWIFLVLSIWWTPDRLGVRGAGSRLENVDNEDPQHVQDRANIGPDDAMILAHAANPDGSNFRK
jgi:hypothetical protein